MHLPFYIEIANIYLYISFKIRIFAQKCFRTNANTI